MSDETTSGDRYLSRLDQNQFQEEYVGTWPAPTKQETMNLEEALDLMREIDAEMRQFGHRHCQVVTTDGHSFFVQQLSPSWRLEHEFDSRADWEQRHQHRQRMNRHLAQRDPLKKQPSDQ